MKTFKYKISKTILVFIILGIIVAFVAGAVNTYFVVKNGTTTSTDPVYPIIQYSIIYLFSILAHVFLISLLISSYYAIDKNYFITSLGIIKSKYKIEDIKTLLLDKQTNKLSVHFENESFLVIVVNQEWYEDFIDELLKANPKIEFSINSKEGGNPKNKDN